MTTQELISQTENQISLLKNLVYSHSMDLKSYPTEKYSLVSKMRVEHCYETLLRLNELLTKPTEVEEY